MKKFLIIILSLIIFSTSVYALNKKRFTDISENDWFYDSVMELSDNLIIKGYDDGSFKPNNNVNRAELASILSRYDDYLKNKNTKHLLLALYQKETNENDLTDEDNSMQPDKFLIKSINSIDGSEKDLGLISSYKNEFMVLNDKIYYINQDNNIETFNILNKSNNIINIPKINYADNDNKLNSIKDFIIYGNEIIYLRGECEFYFGRPCELHRYNLETGVNELIIEDLGNKLEYKLYEGINIKSFNPQKQILVIEKAGGDAALHWIDYYDINIQQKSISQQVIYKYPESTEPIKQEIDFLSDSNCGNAEILNIGGYPIKIRFFGIEKDYEAKYIGCYY